MPDTLIIQERRIGKLESWRDGNSAKGAEQRLQDLEAQDINMSCRTGQRLEKHIVYHREQEGKQVDAEKWTKQMRIMIFGNMIGFGAIIITLLIFVLGG